MTADEYKAMNQGKASQRKGATGEAIARAYLERRYDMVTKIPNDIRIVRTRGEVTGAYPAKKVRTDFFGSERGTGRLMLCEVKCSDSDTLPWSTIKRHQKKALTQNAKRGNPSLLLWVRLGKVCAMQWSDLLEDGFGPKQSIKWRT